MQWIVWEVKGVFLSLRQLINARTIIRKSRNGKDYLWGKLIVCGKTY